MTYRATTKILAALAAPSQQASAWLAQAFDTELGRLAAILANEPDGAFERFHAEGVALFDAHAMTTNLSAEQTAAMVVALTHRRIRDHAWMLTDRYGPEAVTATWAHLARHAPAGYAAPPATLLAYAAWRRGDTVLAKAAIDRALTDDPGYVMAVFIHQALNADVSADGLPLLDPERLSELWGETTT